MIRVLHFRDKCIGCNTCVEVAPERWRISRTDGKSTLIDGVTKKGIQSVVVSKDEALVCDEAARSCPVNVIQVTRG